MSLEEISTKVASLIVEYPYGAERWWAISTELAPGATKILTIGKTLDDAVQKALRGLPVGLRAKKRQDDVVRDWQASRPAEKPVQPPKKILKKR